MTVTRFSFIYSVQAVCILFVGICVRFRADSLIPNDLRSGMFAAGSAAFARNKLPKIHCCGSQVTWIRRQRRPGLRCLERWCVAPDLRRLGVVPGDPDGHPSRWRRAHDLRCMWAGEVVAVMVINNILLLVFACRWGLETSSSLRQVLGQPGQVSDGHGFGIQSSAGSQVRTWLRHVKRSVDGSGSTSSSPPS